MTTELKVAKASYKEALKNKVLYRKRRDAILMQIIESDVPKWGGIKITVTKI
jgi:hypothetical protein